MMSVETGLRFSTADPTVHAVPHRKTDSMCRKLKDAGLDGLRRDGLTLSRGELVSSYCFVAPNNNKPSWYSCAGQAALANWKQVGLDALGLIPLESTGVKAAQLAGGIVSGSISAYNNDKAGMGLSFGGTIINVLNAEKGSIAKNLAEAIPVAGTVVSVGAVGYDIFGSKEYSGCRNGVN